MTEVKTFPFRKDKFDLIKQYHFGLNWPVVYIQENGKEIYIGQTTNLHNRSRQHYRDSLHARLKDMHVIADEELNMSATHDIEALLIQYIAGDGKYKLLNGNGGISHNYYEREKFTAKIDAIWDILKEKNVAEKELKEIRNSDFFKFSPYKALNEDQLSVAEEIDNSLKEGKPVTHIVNGAPGTGKTVLALHLLKHLREDPKTKHLKIALVVPMNGLRATLKKVAKKVSGLGTDSVIGPTDVTKSRYDILLVDEAHRLSRRVNLTNYPGYEAANRRLGLAEDATQLDWILASSKQQVLFYDARQNVIPKDVRRSDFEKLNAIHHELVSQMRIEGGNKYLEFIDNLLDLEKPVPVQRSEYDFKIYDDLRAMISDIKKKDAEHSLARVVAGYAWPWDTRKGKADYDIEIDNIKLVWNSVRADWVNSKNALNEVGCIHTIQGYDLNYAGVIIGPELSYNEEHNLLIVDESKYMDVNGKRAITEPDELQRYIVNIYKTLLTRGIKGTYVYVADDALRKRMKELVAQTAIKS